MAFENVRSLSMTPTSALIRQLRFTVLTTNGNVIESGTAGADSVGIALEASALSDTQAIPVSILDGSIQEVEAGAAIDVSAGVVAIASDAEGRAKAATTGNAILGYALSSAGAAGEIITFISTKAGRQA